MHSQDMRTCVARQHLQPTCLAGETHSNLHCSSGWRVRTRAVTTLNTSAAAVSRAAWFARWCCLASVFLRLRHVCPKQRSIERQFVSLWLRPGEALQARHGRWPKKSLPLGSLGQYVCNLTSQVSVIGLDTVLRNCRITCLPTDNRLALHWARALNQIKSSAMRRPLQTRSGMPAMQSHWGLQRRPVGAEVAARRVRTHLHWRRNHRNWVAPTSGLNWEHDRPRSKSQLLRPSWSRVAETTV